MTAQRPTSPTTGLRGSLPPASLDARAIGRLSKNPRCQRLAAITLVGSSPNKVMEHVFALPQPEEQSKFALAKGARFESVQSQNGAARLIATLQDANIIGAQDVSVRDLRSETGSIRNPAAALQRAITLTDDILRRKAQGDPSAPHIVLQAALAVPLGSGEIACVRPDILVARSTEAMYRPGEMKSYAFFHHLTDQKDVGQAASQMGVYGMALERRLSYLGAVRPIPVEGALIMVRPGGLQSIARLQNIERDISTARRIIDVRPRTLAEITAAIGPHGSLDNPAAILRLNPCYSGKCRAFCALHDICRGEATSQGNPAILGDEIQTMLASAGVTIARASQLLGGAAPANSDEADLQRRLMTLEIEHRIAS